MRQTGGLLLLIAASIALWIGLEHWTESIGWPNWPTVARNLLSETQLTTVAICAALIPGRRMLGAVIIVAFNAVCFLVESVVGTQHSFSAWSTLRDVSFHTAFTLAVFVTIQGFRLFAGWRITLSSELPVKQRGQFQLSELIEWMASWGLLFGLHHLSGSWATANTSNAAQMAVMLLGQLLFGIPIAYLMLSPRL